MSGVSFRPSTASNVPRLSELVRAAHRLYVEQLAGPQRPMTDDYAEGVRSHRVIVVVDPSHQGT
jgi:hypothetical protein